jgi:hypothetical protein
LPRGWWPREGHHPRDYPDVSAACGPGFDVNVMNVLLRVG